MKKILIACMVGFSLHALVDTGKKPVVLKKVNSYVKDKYIVWTTEIKKDPTKDTAPIVSQFQKGYVDTGKQSDQVDVTMHIPQSEIDLSSKIPGAAAEIAGAVNPKAGAVGAAAAVIINEGLSIAGKELTKSNQRSPFDLTVVQIAPSKYYRIVSDKENPNGKIEVTKQFKEDWKKWKAIKKGFAPILKKYNDAVLDYQKFFDAARKRPNDRAVVSRAQNFYANTVKPLLDQKLSFEQQLKAYPLYRAAIMAVIPKEGTACTVGSGPWQLHLFIYVGARVTNKYVIDFCVPNKKGEQQFNILLSNDYHKQGTAQFIPGGIQLTTVDNISFPITVDGITNYGSKTSELYDWYTEFITSSMGDSIDQYLFPFDIYKMQQEYEQKVKDKEIARRDEDIQRLKDAIDKVKSSKGQEELNNSDSDHSGSDTFTPDNSDSSETTSNDSSDNSSNETSADDEGYFPQLKEIKEEIDNRAKDSAYSVYAKKELEVFNKIAEKYLEVVNIQVMAKEDGIKPGSDAAKKAAFKLNEPRVFFYTIQKDIKALSDSSVKNNLLKLAQDLEEGTKLLIAQIETGKTITPSSGTTKADNKEPSKLKQVGNKALEFLKENVTSDTLSKVPGLLKSVFGK